MENLKIAKSKEALDLFFDLGGVSKYEAEYDDYLKNDDSNNLYLCDGYIWTIPDDKDAETSIEITIDQLRDMVVLKRNCVEDATHEDYQKNAWLLTGGDSYMMQDGEWELRGDAPKLLKPIESESLNDKVASAEVARQELKRVEATLAERQSTYGSFTQVANTTGQLMAVILNSPNGHTMPYAHEEALHMICSKIARIVNGNINHADSWHDIGGYAKLIEDIIQGEAS